MQRARFRGRRRPGGGGYPLPGAPRVCAPGDRQRAGPFGPSARGSRCACERERLGNPPGCPREPGGPRPAGQR
eukprot:10295396-Alexandrium_andersonii.AAC.1